MEHSRKHFLHRFVVFTGLLLTCALNTLYAGIVSRSADLVLGQSDYTHNTTNSLNNPFSVAVDTINDRVYVADQLNNRVLWWDHVASLTSGKAADGVLGQPDFTTTTAACTATAMHFPECAFVDGSGNLWVADSQNCRILKFSHPIISGQAASLVLGQPDFTSSYETCTSTGLRADIRKICVDNSGNLWVADFHNHRVLKYDNPTINGQAANLVIGQAGFNSSLSACTQIGMSYPHGIDVDSAGNLWVTEGGNHRVLKFSNPATNGQAATIVLGQSNFTSRVAACTQSGMNNPHGLVVDNSGNVWVADASNNRVLKYTNPTLNGQSASLVLGQPNFTSNAAACTQTGMNNPLGVDMDGWGNLWVADCYNNRVVKFSKTSLSYTGENNYVSSALYPQVGTSTSTYIYRIKYANHENSAPGALCPKLRVYKNNIEILGSPYVMGAADITDTTYSDGKIYTCDIGLAAGSDYTYTIEAFDVNGTSATAITGSGPVVLSALMTGSIAGRVTVSNGAAALSGAYIEALQFGVTKSSALSDGNGDYSITLATGTYDIRASKAGYVTSTKTECIISTHTALTVDFTLVGVAAPSAPSEITGVAISTDAIQWSWNMSSGATYYQLYSLENKLVANIESTLSCTEEHLSANTQYKRYVKAGNQYGLSPASSTTVRYTLANTPHSPLIVKATKHSILLFWDGNGCTRFRVDRSTTNDFTGTVVSKTWEDNITANYYYDTGLYPHTKYYYALKGYNGDAILTSQAVFIDETTEKLKEKEIHPGNGGKEQCNKTVGNSILNVEVDIPPAAISCAAYVAINTDPVNNPIAIDASTINSANRKIKQASNKQLAEDTAVEFNMYDLTGSSITVFSDYVTLSLPYQDADNDGYIDDIIPKLKEENLEMCYLNPSTCEWENIGGTVDTQHKVVKVRTKHFSVYSLMGFPRAQANLKDMLVYPNPYKPGSGGLFDNSSKGVGIVFSNLTADSRVQIFNLAGELVREFEASGVSGEYIWDTTNNAGQKVSSGTYIYIAFDRSGNAEKIKGKISIIR